MQSSLFLVSFSYFSCTCFYFCLTNSISAWQIQLHQISLLIYIYNMYALVLVLYPRMYFEEICLCIHTSIVHRLTQRHNHRPYTKRPRVSTSDWRYKEILSYDLLNICFSQTLCVVSYYNNNIHVYSHILCLYSFIYFFL